MAVRFDRGGLNKPKKQPNGWLRVDGWIARTGVQVYRRQDGTTIREYRPPEEVFNADALESFGIAPLTNDHPPEGLLDAENTKRYQVGTVVAPRQDGKLLRAQMLITDADAIAALESGKTQLSCGYVCELDETPGTTPDGEHYDAVQRAIRGNHVAIVQVGRAGPEVRVKMDAATAVDDAEHSLHSANNEPIQNESDEAKMIKFKLDSGVEIEVSEAAASLLQDQSKKAAEKVAALQVDLDKSNARADSAEAMLKTAKAELEAAPAKYAEAAKARAKLIEKASAIMPEANFDADSDAQVKRKVVEFARPGMKLDGKSEAYVDAAFDMLGASEDEDQDEESTAEITEHADAADPVEKAQREFYAHLEKLNSGNR
jgi:uncharacterized protein